MRAIVMSVRAASCMAALLALMVGLAACGSSVQRIESDVTGLDGIRQNGNDGNKTLVVFTTHGIGVHCIGHSLRLFEAVAPELKLVRSRFRDNAYDIDNTLLRKGGDNICAESVSDVVDTLPPPAGNVPAVPAGDPLRPPQDRYCDRVGRHGCRPLIFEIGGQRVLYGYLRHWEYRPQDADRSDQPPAAVVYELTWSPITLPHKLQLLGADGLSFARYREAVGPVSDAARFRSDRDTLNRALKTGLINTHFSDAVMYLGRLRPHIQMAFYESLCLMAFDLEDPQNKEYVQQCPYRKPAAGNPPPRPAFNGRIGQQNIAIMTHSLASRIIFDLFEQSRGAIANYQITRLNKYLREQPAGRDLPVWDNSAYWLRGPYSSSLYELSRHYSVGIQQDMTNHPVRVMEEVMRGLDAVYMLANQLPLLELAMLDTSQRSGPVELSTADLDARLVALMGRLRQSSPEVAAAPQSAPAVLAANAPKQVVEVIEQMDRRAPQLAAEVQRAERAAQENQQALRTLERDRQAVEARAAQLDRSTRRGGVVERQREQLKAEQEKLGGQIVERTATVTENEVVRAQKQAELQEVKDPARVLLRPDEFEVRKTIMIYAFSDPNDLLTYRLDSDEYLNRLPDAKLVSNIIVDNPGLALPGLFSHPLGAHNGFADNAQAMHVVACGSEKSRLLKAMCQ